MKRDEFSAKTKDQAHTRSKGFCENKRCGLPLVIGHIHYDHILPCALGGKATLANCQVLCAACHAEKTGKDDVPRIRKADRQRKAHIGATAPKQQIKSRGFDATGKTPRIDKAELPHLPRRNIYTNERN
jgi:5-methylcytosine-specific restriction enzyme A